MQIPIAAAKGSAHKTFEKLRFTENSSKEVIQERRYYLPAISDSSTKIKHKMQFKKRSPTHCRALVNVVF